MTSQNHSDVVAGITFVDILDIFMISFLTPQCLKKSILYCINAVVSKDSEVISVNHKRTITEINNPFSNAEKLVKCLLKTEKKYYRKY